MPASPNRSPSKLILAASIGVGILALVGMGAYVITSADDPVADSASRSGASPIAPPQAAHALEAGLASASEYQSKGQFAEAGTILAKLAESSPTDSRIRLAWAQALLGQKEFARAYDQYTAAIAIEQGSGNQTAQEKFTNNPRLAELHGEAGVCANSAGLLDRAIEHFSMAQTADATNPRYPLFLAMTQLKLGGPENDAAAMANLVRATVLNPDSAEAWGTMAELELRQNRNDLAAQHLEKALTLQPEQPKWRIAQARVLNRQGHPDRAVSILSSLEEPLRTSDAVLKLAGESYGLLNEPAKAAAMYESAAKSRPTDPALWYEAAQWHKRAGHADAAKKAATTAAMLGHEPAREFVQAMQAE